MILSFAIREDILEMNRLPLSMSAALAALALCFSLGTAVAADGPAFTIVSPTEGATLTSPVTVTVEVENAEIGRPADGLNHLHIAVDDGRGKSIYESTPQVYELAPGSHTIYVELAGPNHRGLLPVQSVTFTVE